VGDDGKGKRRRKRKVPDGKGNKSQKKKVYVASARSARALYKNCAFTLSSKTSRAGRVMSEFLLFRSLFFFP
jgi:hypothetical protein